MCPGTFLPEVLVLTQKRLKEVCDYDPNTGSLLWKEPGKKRVVGERVGSLGSHGYLETSIDYHRCLVHRLVWLWHHGEFPAEHTDHINHDRVDNRIENLRSVTNRQNNFNQRKRIKRTSSRYKGVSWNTRRRKWKAAIKLGNKHLTIGYYASEFEAALKYNQVATEYYGPYAHLNSVMEEE